MKPCSSAAQAILSGGEYVIAGLYSITLTTGAAAYLTDFDIPLSAAIALTNTTFGSTNTYLTGYTIIRGQTVQATGMQSQEMELDIAPQWDSPGGPPLVGGYSLMQAARLGLMDNAVVTYAKMPMSVPASGASYNTAGGGIGWYTGVCAIEEVTRFHVKLKVTTNLLVLNTVQMPRNLFQPMCAHTFGDTGCTLSRATYTFTGTVGTVTNNANFNTNLTKADGYFSLGSVKFTSGANTGFQATIKSYLNASGNIQTVTPLPNAVATGDAFSAIAGDDRTQATCSSKFSNLAHFKATPYVPVPETLYDGGTSTPVGSSIVNLPVGSGPSARTLPK